jgi:hypothetical protein
MLFYAGHLWMVCVNITFTENFFKKWFLGDSSNLFLNDAHTIPISVETAIWYMM